MNFFFLQANSSAKFHRRKRDKSCSKDSDFLCRITLRHGIKVRQDLYLSMRKLLAIFPTVFSFQLTSFVQGL